jgi:type I restriction enzyme S subunit
MASKARLGWKGLKASEYIDDGYIFLSTPNIKSGEIDFQNVKHITAERYFESPEIMLKTGDVLIAKDGSTLGITSVVRFLPAPATVNSSIAVIRPTKSIQSVFLYWFLSSNYIQELIQAMKDGMGVPHLFQADIRKFVVLIPPLSEQQAVADYLDHETAKIDGLISKIGQGIEKLKEYSTALISAAVTGKIDVREAILDN